MSTGNLISYQSSGTQTAGKVIKTGQGVCGYILATASTSLAVAIFDGLDTTGATGTNLTGTITLSVNVQIPITLGFGTGLTVQVVSGSGSYFVGYV